MAAANAHMRIKIVLKFWLPVVFWMVGIYFISGLPKSDVPELFPFQDVIYHLLAYAVLAFLFGRAFKNSSPGLAPRHILLLAAFFGSLYGVSDEFHQSFVPGRSASGIDLLMDTLGSIAGGRIYLWPR